MSKLQNLVKLLSYLHWTFIASNLQVAHANTNLQKHTKKIVKLYWKGSTHQ